jgi:cytoskeletal protein CcmA (bactofilin family)
MTGMNDPKNPIGGAATAQKRTLVEDGTRFKGSLTSTCPILVQGTVEGDVEGPSLTVSATGAVSGKIVTGNLKSDGKIAGEFDVDSAQLAGSVANNTVIHATSLDVKLTIPSGKLQLTFGPAGAGGAGGRGRS